MWLLVAAAAAGGWLRRLKANHSQQQIPMALKDGKAPKLYVKMPNLTSETHRKNAVILATFSPAAEEAPTAALVTTLGFTRDVPEVYVNHRPVINVLETCSFEGVLPALRGRA